MNKKIIVKEEIILFNLLKKINPDFSNKKIKQLVKFDGIFVNKKIEHNVNRIIKINDIVTFNNVKKSNIDIIYEDKEIIVINKPAGLLSISTNKEKVLTAYHMVSDYVKQTCKNNKIFVVHRLDESTSGILIFAKNEKIKRILQNNWNDLVKLREYYAIVPCKTKEKDTIKSYLQEDKTGMVYVSKIGKIAITNYELIKYKNNYSLLKINIETGRKNQIRVHLKEFLSPIVGDKKYGSSINPINRLCLHASKVIIIHPFTHKTLTFESNIPLEMLKMIK